MDDKNLDRVYDGLSADEIETIFKTLERTKEMQKGKNGLDDCMQDSAVRTTTEQQATKTVKEAVLSKGRKLDENEQQK